MIKKISVIKETKNGKAILKEYLLFSKKSFIFVALFSFVVNFLMLVPAIYMLAIYDIVIPSRSMPTLLFITFLVVLLYIISWALQIIRTKVLQVISTKLDTILNKDVVFSTFALAIKNPTKASIQPLNDLNQIKQFLTSQTLFALFDLPWVPIYLITLFIFHHYYGFTAVGVIFIILVITILNEFLTKKELEVANEALIKSSNFLNHAMRNAEIIEALGMKENIYEKWKTLYLQHMITFQNAVSKNTFWSNLIKTVRIMFQSLMLGLGGYLAIKQEISIGMIVAGSILLSRIMSPIDLLISTWRNFSSTRLAYRRLNQLLNKERDEKKFVKLPPPKGEINMKQVFVIPPETEEAVLKNITMKIFPGETVAIIGPSGSGKSSLARTILGIWEPVNGKVEIDGADINQWDRKYLGQFVGYLPQDIELFEGTVAENIARFTKVDSERVLEAAVLSGAHEIIVKLPNGYNTYIGPGGITLSAGQRQRIALARALYGNPRIVVLDEPDSNLDEKGEIALYNALVELKKRKTTVIVISHKLRILNLADKIALIQDGTLKIYGKADIVLQKLIAARNKVQS